ncbi:uncharacterized protein (DUF305 family) [Knoellia remsis]|uniref:Uncharacterized protein (DUF305 family) n=1 Tax=Knoellia remsis TaxID=407159 RepID=A0A2T0ULT0_9MICO|nr:DUF305 domain-containing protein [Knoellia remsis]PRY58787.1 uncharacterized protein (DUF305 family) [Knoellia remsis]
MPGPATRPLSLSRRLAPAAALVAALAVSGCTGDDGAESLPATTAPTPSGPVIQPKKPGEPNATLTGSDAAPVTTPTVNPADAKFYQDMIVHHSQAIVMVESVKDRLTDTQVKGLAERIAAEQEPEVAAMAAWLKERKQDVPPQATNPRLGDHSAHAGMPGMATPAQMKQLSTVSGPAADQLFLKLMITHHEGALKMVEEQQAKGTDEYVGDISSEIYTTQSVQIRMMQQMLTRLS